MSNPLHRNRRRGVGLGLAAAFAFAAFPAGAQAALSPVDLGTAGPFVVLGGQEVTNTGPSVLNGRLGVAPGTSLTGFQFATVNGATHVNDGVANQAQADLTTAYDVAAGQTPATDLSGSNLGGQVLTAGAYSYSSDAQLTGTVTLDAENDPTAQFVIKVGTQLTTASSSRVELARGASPCNVFWKVDTAVLGSATAFQGNVLALTSISLGNGATVLGRLLARNGTVSLINNTLDNSQCTDDGTTPTGGTTTGGTTASGTPDLGGSSVVPGAGTAQGAPVAQPSVPTLTRNGSAIMRRSSRRACTAGFRATVRGRMIRRVVFSLDGRRVRHDSRSPFSVNVRAAPGRHRVTARVTFKDATRARTLSLGYRACAAAVLRPRNGPSRFTG